MENYALQNLQLALTITLSNNIEALHNQTSITYA